MGAMVTGSVVDVILVPEGFEHRAVQASLPTKGLPAPLVLPVPIGPEALSVHLHQLISSGTVFKPASRILLMGLGGALSEGLRVGNGVLIRECARPLEGTGMHWTPCDPALTAAIAERLDGIHSGRLVTSAGVVCSSAEKQRLSSQTRADVVDMEGHTTVEILSAAGHQVAILRVVSDERDHDLPELAGVVSATGSVLVQPLLLAFLKRPLAAVRLISGSLLALRALGQLTRQLVGGDAHSAA